MPAIQDWEIWACAIHYHRRYGEQALSVVKARIDDLEYQNDTKGVITFRAIYRRIEQLAAGSDVAIQ